MYFDYSGLWGLRCKIWAESHRKTAWKALEVGQFWSTAAGLEGRPMLNQRPPALIAGLDQSFHRRSKAAGLYSRPTFKAAGLEPALGRPWRNSVRKSLLELFWPRSDPIRDSHAMMSHQKLDSSLNPCLHGSIKGPLVWTLKSFLNNHFLANSLAISLP